MTEWKELEMKRVALPIVVLLFAALNAGGLYALASVHPATPPAAAKPAPVPVGPALQPFVATGLPTGRAIGVPQHIVMPTGYTLKHMHPGNHYVFVLSGVVQITDDKGTKTYRAGMFIWEPAWHVHTVHVLQQAEIVGLAFVPPGYTQRVTIPVK